MIKISDSELEIMKILWDKGVCTSFDIIEEIKKENDWNDSTIRTLMARLQSKGAIKITEKNGRVYSYIAVINENEYALKESKNLLQKFYNGSINNMLLNFTKQNELSKEELKSLIDMIESED